MFDLINITKALSDENRIRILMALRGKELCVCTLTELLGLASSTTSKHLSILKQARLIESVKEGKFVYYRLVSDNSPNYRLAEQATGWVSGAIEDSAQIRADAERLAEIIEKGEEVGTGCCTVTADRKLYRHVPGIHAIGDFGGERK